VGGVAQKLEPYYICANIVGIISKERPSQSLTHYPLTAFDRVFGTNDVFSRSDMNRMAGGGNTIIIQEPLKTGLITIRQSLTTDMTSIDTWIDSITVALDYGSKYLRSILEPFIGRRNITQSLLEEVGSTTDSGLKLLVKDHIWAKGTLRSLKQKVDEQGNKLDGLILVVEMDPEYPCNSILVEIHV
jgi:hypothetical protein